MTQPDNRNKDECIQRLKSLLYDCKWAVDSDHLVAEIEKAIRDAGGYDPLTETSVSKLRWAKK